GMAYGTRNDYKAYAPVQMIDIKWKNYDWARYMNRVDEYRPPMAMVADYEHSDQKELLYSQIRDLEKLHIGRVMACPKFVGAIFDIPKDCLIAVSVPTTYAGFLPDFSHLNGRDVHLLGGRPEKQAELLRKLIGAGANVVSVDGSYHAMKAGFGQWFDGGRWVKLYGRKESNLELTIASGKNITAYLKRIAAQTQAALF
ncbi:MAG TPA: DUF6610 family protein, partial [Terriglobales bacterium]|nr:DUF6610 family protein [Terriglobales bacterium]